MNLLKSAAAALLLALTTLVCAAPAAAQTVEYVHTAALGSVVAVTDANRNIVERREYEPYGYQLTPTLQNGPGYTGHVQDASTGLTYMQQRYYDPLLGRFLSVDPVTMHDTGDARHFNRYGYANNNPYTFVDPDGRLPIFIPALIVYGVGALLHSDPANAPAPGEAIERTSAAEALMTALPPARALAPVKMVMQADQPKHTIPNERAPHIFREKEGHVRDTPQNREALTRVADDPKTTLGTDKYGNTWSAQRNNDGTQTWTQTRNGEVINGGVNQTPRTFNPETGLSRPVRPEQELKR